MSRNSSFSRLAQFSKFSSITPFKCRTACEQICLEGTLKTSVGTFGVDAEVGVTRENTEVK